MVKHLTGNAVAHRWIMNLHIGGQQTCLTTEAWYSLNEVVICFVGSLGTMWCIFGKRASRLEHY